MSLLTQRSGRIEVIRGCMFSGKTERLIARLRVAERGGNRVIAFKHMIDDRYDATHLITHTQDRFPAQRARDVAAISRLAGAAQVIGIDEGQFFGMELIDMVTRLADSGRRLIIVGIDYDVWGRPFSPIPELSDIADEVLYFYAACRGCGGQARFSQRTMPLNGGSMVGGAEAYEPRCQKCFQPLPVETASAMV